MSITPLTVAILPSDEPEELRMLLAHIHAQIMLICGEGLENFCNHSDEIKSNYLWAIAETAERALRLIDDESVAAP
jgi:hypothetical protein